MTGSGFLSRGGFLSGGRHLSGVLLLVGILVPAPSHASQTTASPRVGANSRATNPYNKLFQPQSVDQFRRVQRSAPLQTEEPRVVCGMTIIPVNPNIDPKMMIEPKADQTRYTIRAIDPPICWQR